MLRTNQATAQHIEETAQQPYNIEKLMTVLKKTKNITYNIGKVKTLLKKTKKNKISTETPGAQVRLDIVSGFCFIFVFFQ